jgi:hypothetical protein
MELYCTPKVNTLQLNAASNSSNTRTRPTFMVPEHSHIEFFQQDLLWQSSNTHSHSCSQKASKHTKSIRRQAIGPLVHHNGTSAHSPRLTCHLPAPAIECLHRPRYELMCSSRQSVALRITSNLYSFSDPTDKFIPSPFYITMP